MTNSNHDPTRLDKVFMALADRTRRQLVHMLAESDRTVSELAAPFEMSLAAVSKHIKVLESAGIIKRAVSGRIHRCSLRPEELTGALDWISLYRNFWSRRLDALEETLNQNEEASDERSNE